ncbi:MAG: Rieske 2Fe-2S family protein [Hyphomonadaceae bacterium]|nr:MAG: Rieske 2Fe-2S family protein [Hyphomonadaceae bacterium]KAF0186869.1 MAG: Rieske 2Fe-2S family protein [Hyphomonadaceae bacterium]
MAEDTTTTLPLSVPTEHPKGDDGLLRDCWYFGGTSAELKPAKHIRRMMLGEPVLIGRTKCGKPFAMRDICPHRLVPLSEGRQLDHEGETVVECPYHGWRFGTDGGCKHMPSLTDDSPIDATKVKVRHYPTHEAHGLVFVYVSSNPRFSGEAPIPPPDFGLRADKPKFIVSQIFNATMDNAVVGLMDPAHVGFVHNQWWWRPPSSGLRLKEKQFVPRHLGWAVERHAPSGNSVAYRWVFGEKVTTEICFMLPGYRWEVIENGKAQFFTLTCLTPINETQTLIVQTTYWDNAPLLNLMLPILPGMGRKFLDQDGRMVDMQNFGLAHQKNMLWIDDIDVQAKWYQRLKREWREAIAEKREFKNPINATILRWRS